MVMSAAPLLHPARVDGAVDLLSAAAESLASAHWASTVHGRSAGTRLAVLRAAAAVLAVRTSPGPAADRAFPEERGRSAVEPRRDSSGPVDVWTLLPRVAPELTEWADFFAAVLPEGGVDPHDPGRLTSVREADDLLRQGEEFVQLVAGVLGLPPVPVAVDLTSLTGPAGEAG